jgi:hypothetical protein
MSQRSVVSAGVTTPKAPQKPIPPQNLVELVQSLAEARANQRPRTDSKSKFITELRDTYLKDYLQNPTPSAGRAAVATIGSVEGSPRERRVHREVEWSDIMVDVHVPRVFRRNHPEVPKRISAAVHMLKNRNLNLIDVPHLLGADNLKAITDQDGDWGAGGRNLSQLMHWGTGVGGALKQADTVRDLFVAYEKFHEEGWSNLNEDPINDLIAEEQGRLLGLLVSAGKVTNENLVQLVDETFQEARAWTGAVLRLRRPDFKKLVSAENYKGVPFWGSFSTLKQLSAQGKDLSRQGVTHHLAGLMALTLEADAWERRHGPIHISPFIKKLVQGQLDQEVAAAKREEFWFMTPTQSHRVAKELLNKAADRAASWFESVPRSK